MEGGCCGLVGGEGKGAEKGGTARASLEEKKDTSGVEELESDNEAGRQTGVGVGQGRPCLPSPRPLAA